jgi:hypothetical protein
VRQRWWKNRRPEFPTIRAPNSLVVDGAVKGSEQLPLLFTYGRSYLERMNAISSYLPELPVRTGPISRSQVKWLGVSPTLAPIHGASE